jgi:hypothetical protein
MLSMIAPLNTCSCAEAFRAASNTRAATSAITFSETSDGDGLKDLKEVERCQSLMSVDYVSPPILVKLSLGDALGVQDSQRQPQWIDRPVFLPV